MHNPETYKTKDIKHKEFKLAENDGLVFRKRWDTFCFFGQIDGKENCNNMNFGEKYKKLDHPLVDRPVRNMLKYKLCYYFKQPNFDKILQKQLCSKNSVVKLF